MCVQQLHRFSDISILTDNWMLGHDIKKLPGEDMYGESDRERENGKREMKRVMK